MAEGKAVFSGKMRAQTVTIGNAYGEGLVEANPVLGKLDTVYPYFCLILLTLFVLFVLLV